MTEHHYHAVIWIDHREARVFHFNPTDVETLVLHPDNPTRHIHHKANSIGSGHASTSPDYLHGVAESVSDAGAVLITGPGNAKTELVEFIRLHDPKLDKSDCGRGDGRPSKRRATRCLCQKISQSDGPDGAVVMANFMNGVKVGNVPGVVIVFGALFTAIPSDAAPNVAAGKAFAQANCSHCPSIVNSRQVL